MSHMKNGLAIKVILIVIVCLAILLVALFAFQWQTPAQTPAQTRVTGVKAGDYFIYAAESFYTSDNASMVPPSMVELANATDQYRIDIQGVSEVNVTESYTWSLSNGTEYAYLVTQDVVSGQSYYQSFNVPPLEILTGANITVGSLLHPNGNDTITVNQTISRNYSSGARDTNVIEISRSIIDNSTDNTATGISTTKFYIDKATGVIVREDSEIVHWANPNVSMTLIWFLQGTNAFQV
jgi:hypothetical protein